MTRKAMDLRAPLPADLRGSLATVADDPTLRDERDPLERYDFYVEPPEVGA